MKFLITGDLHLDVKKPRNRTETYLSDMKDKVYEICQIAKDKKVNAILQPGDFCNTSKLPERFKTYWIKAFRKFSIPIYTIPGQHDMKYHSSDIEDTPLGVLAAAKVIEILLTWKDNRYFVNEPVNLYGAGWEQEIPEIAPFVQKEERGCNILLTHRMISDAPLWPGHEYTDALKLLDKNDFDLIVSGDNHKHFTYESLDGKWLINCGSLMRSSIDQKDHKPVVYIYDTETKRPTQIYLKVKPFNEVMRIEEAEAEKERNKELDLFIEGLSETNIEGLDFKKNLIEYLNENKDTIDRGTVDIINELMG